MSKIEKKTISAAAAAAKINSGDTIYVTGGATQPLAFLEALGKRPGLTDVTVYSTYTIVPPDAMVRQSISGAPVAARNPIFKTLLVGPGERHPVKMGAVQFVPIGAHDIADLFKRERMDVIVVGCASEPLGDLLNISCSCAFTRSLLEVAASREALILGEVNPQLPWCKGDTEISADLFDYLIHSDRAVPESQADGSAGREALVMGGFLAGLVPDGATLHLGLGGLVAKAAAALKVKRNLGVHSDYLGEAMLSLFEKGAINSSEKTFMPGMWVGSYVAGSRRLYNYVDRNDSVQMHTLDFVARLTNIARNKKMISITQASQVDLSGQVAVLNDDFDSHGYLGVQHAFHRGASLAEGGMGILLLPTRSPESGDANIVARLSMGATVVIPSYDVDVVVSEHGVARLRGKSMAQRALDLIAISPPTGRSALMTEARKLGFV